MSININQYVALCSNIQKISNYNDYENIKEYARQINTLSLLSLDNYYDIMNFALKALVQRKIRSFKQLSMVTSKINSYNNNYNIGIYTLKNNLTLKRYYENIHIFGNIK